MEGSQQHPRLILRNFLSLDVCKELEFIHKSCCTVGYRQNVFSTTLSHLIATNSSHLIIPFVPIRERLKEKVEEYFGCEYELFVEFTGLISWCRGASIGWHSDDNRDYLKQRDFAAVCYLNNYEVDFKGGLFHFQDGEPSTIVPMAGDVAMYTADNKNIHSVDEIMDGERITLTLWFSRDASHDEDAKLISLLSDLPSDSPKSVFASYLPVAASNKMYSFPPEEESGFDIRCARLHVLGFDLYFSDEESSLSALDSSYYLPELLRESLQLVLGDKLLVWKFVNILHAVQMVQFWHWKASELKTTEVKALSTDVIIPLSKTQQLKINSQKLVLLKDPQLAETFFGGVTGRNNLQQLFDLDWVSFSDGVSEWEAYTSKLQKEMLMSLPYWISHQSIFSLVHFHQGV
ncbi:2-oxoglutarate (2OG) and Fe(II)-dependent oxygenase superfamily protein [Abeliophyllum distichum]|uniref:procollagen-proline 3-dioxygenase n=1 Tax=Abeliophyllum distichum TaxID=126358 RepID=A0ABD1VXU2_9LAMI